MIYESGKSQVGEENESKDEVFYEPPKSVLPTDKLFISGKNVIIRNTLFIWL